MANIDQEALAVAAKNNQLGIGEEVQRPLYINTTSELLRTEGVSYAYLGQNLVICIVLADNQLTPTVNSLSPKEGAQILLPAGNSPGAGERTL